jgi:hypothetical protein
MTDDKDVVTTSEFHAASGFRRPDIPLKPMLWLGLFGAFTTFIFFGEIFLW